MMPYGIIKPIMTNHRWDLPTFTWGQFHRKCSRYQTLITLWKLLIQNYWCISLCPMNEHIWSKDWTFKPGQHHSCWCPDSWYRQVINISYSVDNEKWVGPWFWRGRILISCAISVRSNDPIFVCWDTATSSPILLTWINFNPSMDK